MTRRDPRGSVRKKRAAKPRKTAAKLFWRLSDDTVVHLGGQVEGASAFAAELRDELANNPQLSIGLMPSICNIALDVDDAVLMNEWLRLKTWSREPRLVEAPKNVADVSARWPELYESIPGRIY